MQIVTDSTDMVEKEKRGTSRRKGIWGLFFLASSFHRCNVFIVVSYVHATVMRRVKEQQKIRS